MKMKWILGVAFLASCLLLPAPARAQFTTVSGTVLDPNGIPYAGGTLSATLVPGSPGGFTLGGQPYSGQIGGATLDVTGSFVVNFGTNASITPAGTQWRITVSSNPGGIPGPLGTGAQSFTVTITIAGATQNIGATLSAAAPRLTNFISAGGVTSVTGVAPITSTGGATPAIGCATCTTGTIAATQIAVGSGANTISGSPALTSGGNGDIEQTVPVLASSILRTFSVTGTPNFLGFEQTFTTASFGALGQYGLQITGDGGNSIGVLNLYGDGSASLQTATQTAKAIVQTTANGSIQLCPNFNGTAACQAGTGVSATPTSTTLATINQGNFVSDAFAARVNCSSAGGTCGTAAAGAVSIAAGATTVTVSTSEVTALSNIQVTADSSNSTRLGVTCNATVPAVYSVTARAPGTSFTITATAPIANPACFDFLVVN